MFGPFRASNVCQGGLLWKARMKMDLSRTQKTNIRKRLKAADDVVMKIQESGVQCNALTKLQAEPTQAQMPAKDKYTVFSRTFKGYRKSVHKVPHFTKVAVPRTAPNGF
ncbi:hypothetical protein BGZ65_010307 [Modicella reniformis]|uniref:Mitochondrial ribosomal protein L31 n=1 Tax=Modicella reniformis TaxID=1440133 RepID=A0A9P6LTU8_9FUNG|nr:hypothetical protein BGZ65_010307 [Modicella reniformis]